MVKCEKVIDIRELIQPIMLMSLFKKEEKISLDKIIELYVNDMITEKLMESVTLPQEFADLEDVICLQMQMTSVQALTALLRGEEVPEGLGLDKVLDMVVNLQLLAAISKAFSGGGSQGGGSSGGSSTGG